LGEKLRERERRELDRERNGDEEENEGGVLCFCFFFKEKVLLQWLHYLILNGNLVPLTLV